MVTLRLRGGSTSMAIDTSGVCPPHPTCRRGTVAAYKFRVREERKRVIRLSNEKYRNIDDHESGLRRFVLIKNTLRRLHREIREEKLAKHRAGGASVSPSYLSASRPRSPSPPCDMEVSDVLSVYGQPTPAPLTSLDDDDHDPTSPPKKPKLFHDDDKENSRDGCEERLQYEVDQKEESRMAMDDTQEILRDLYESYTEPLSQPRPPTPTPPRPDTPYSASSYSLPANTAPSLTASSNTSTMTNSTISSSYSTNVSTGSSYYDWSRPQQQQYACGHASLLGNDLQSVVFHSLIASLES